MNGIETTERIRGMAEPGASTPIIGITASAIQSELEACLQAGMDVCLTKPIDSHELLTALYRLTAVTDSKPSENRWQWPVLIVDDVEINRTAAAKQLAKLGLSYETAADGLEALELAKNADYAAILVDILMPKMDGIEFVEKLRAWEKTHERRTPVVAMTGRADPEDREHYLSAGMDDVLGKPVAIERLSAVLAKWNALPDSGDETTANNPFKAGNGGTEDPVDLRELIEIIGNEDESVLFALLNVFVDEFPSLVEKLEDAIAAQNARAVHDAAHAAKSAAANAATPSLVRLLESLESNASTEDWIEFARITERLKSDYKRVKSFCANRR